MLSVALGCRHALTVTAPATWPRGSRGFTFGLSMPRCLSPFSERPPYSAASASRLGPSGCKSVSHISFSLTGVKSCIVSSPPPSTAPWGAWQRWGRALYIFGEP